MDVRAFYETCAFPEEAVAVVTAATEKLRAAVDFDAWQARLYGGDSELWQELTAIAEQLGIHRFTAHLALLAHCVPEAKRRYAEAGIPEDIYWDSMKDIRFKMMETHYIHGVWGVYCGQWLSKFLTRDIICLGRLQFEPVQAQFACRIGDRQIDVGDAMLSVHIPSFGKLVYADVLDAYRRAGVFFRDRFPGGEIWLRSVTWILYPPVHAMLPEGNMRRWAEDYKVVHTKEDPSGTDLYRIFHLPNGTPIDRYPDSNTLQRRLKAWILEGNSMGLGCGYLLLQDGEICRG